MGNTRLPTQSVSLNADRVTLEGDLALPDDAHALVLFAHGSGSSRFSPRNRSVAQVLNEAHLATLLLDLLSSDEQRLDDLTGQLRFDIDLLARRLVSAIDWAQQDSRTRGLHLGLFGASTGAAAALVAAAQRPHSVRTVVSRGGRPDLAGDSLTRVTAPVLLIVGGNDLAVIDMNRAAARLLPGETRLQIVPGASHLFEEPGTLEEVAALARDWFLLNLTGIGLTGAGPDRSEVA